MPPRTRNAPYSEKKGAKRKRPMPPPAREPTPSPTKERNDEEWQMVVWKPPSPTMAASSSLEPARNLETKKKRVKRTISPPSREMRPRTRNSPYAEEKQGGKRKKTNPPPRRQQTSSPRKEPSTSSQREPAPSSRREPTPSPPRERTPEEMAPVVRRPRPPSPIIVASSSRETFSIRQLSSCHKGATEPLPPETLCFKHTEYAKICKIASKCEEYNTVDAITALRGGEEKEWFRNHPQFQHIWHMERSKNHKLMGMWMLLLRTVAMEKGKTCWFVVNGVPVRYSLKEHALISGLDCHNYPPEYLNMGSFRFVKKHFGKTDNISVGEVREKMKKMAGSGERLKMAVLLFLSTVIKGSKRYGYIDPFILRIVDDVDACKTFPWGRYTFDDCLDEIFHMLDHFKGVAKPTWCFPGFIIPLELLACESIPELRKKFREDVPNADRGCPRMCKQRWQTPTSGGYLKGFPLEDINEALGETEKTISILEPEVCELDLLSRILEDGVDDEGEVEKSKNWNKWLAEEKKKLFWKDFFELDKAGRAVTAKREKNQSGDFPAMIGDVPNCKEDVLKNLQESLMKVMQDGFEKMNTRFDALEKRVTLTEKMTVAGDEDEVEREEDNAGGKDAEDAGVEPDVADDAGGGAEAKHAGAGVGENEAEVELELDGAGEEAELELDGAGEEAEPELDGAGEEAEPELDGAGEKAEQAGASSVQTPYVRRRTTRPSKFAKSPYI